MSDGFASLWSWLLPALSKVRRGGVELSSAWEEQFSPAILRAIEWSRRQAHGRSSAEVALDDLVVGLLCSPESPAAAFLVAKGLDPDPLKRRLTVGRETPDEHSQPIPLGSGVKSVLDRSRQLAVSLSRFDLVGSDELIVSLCEAVESADILRRHGVDPAAIVTEYHASRSAELVAVDPADTLQLGDSPDAASLLRILDANVNRLREALRVLEDYARFALDDVSLCSRLKQCRHALRDAFEQAPAHLLALARDVAGDVGTSVQAEDEYVRRGLTDVVAANCKRAQESARSIEEYLKTQSPAAARSIEKLRYELYAVERALLAATSVRGRLGSARLYWLADPNACVKALDWMIEQAVLGGVDVIQLRDKESRDRELLELAREIQQLTRKLGVLFIMNDRPDLAKLAQADGVHIGQEELTVRDARKIVGPEVLVGVSTHDIDQARRAVRDGADYIGVGPVFPSKTKAFGDFPGLRFVEEVVREIPIPAFCIGGINLENVSRILATGGRRIAVANILNSDPEPISVARSLRGLLDAKFE